MGYKNLKDNASIKKRDPKHVVYSDESYAQEMYDKFCDFFDGKPLMSKDMSVGQMCQAEVISVSNGKILVQAESSQAIYLDLHKESRFLQKHQIDSGIARGTVIDIMVDNVSNGLYTGSIEKAYNKKLKDDLMSSIKTQSSAYNVTIKSINDGGFIVDLAGLDCFMPGSLAAANKIINFESMIGKEVYVMVENYLDASDMFVVSNKKYIQSILPTKIKELNYTQQYTGIVTGVLAYGCFIEWDTIFTGLLHESEIVDTVLKDLKAGDEVSFWIKEIKENNRIILSQKGASTENLLYQTFKDEWEGEVFEDARIKDIKSFGIFVEMGDIVGMLSPREFKKTNVKLKEGEYLDVLVKQVDVSSKKIFLKSIELE